MRPVDASTTRAGEVEKRVRPSTSLHLLIDEPSRLARLHYFHVEVDYEEYSGGSYGD
jgi:hypothetical protein